MKTILDLVIVKALAADGPLGAGFQSVVTSRTGAESFWSKVPEMITSVANWLLSLIAIFCVFMVVVGGYQYLLGAVEGEGKGKQTVIYALSGLVISLLAYVIVATLLGVLGTNPTDFTPPNPS